MAALAVGQKQGRLTVLEKLGPLPEADGKRRRAAVLVRCDCGAEKTVFENAIIRGHTQSCGCLCREMVSRSRMIHGEVLDRTRKPTPEYQTWQRVIQRCTDPKKDNYEEYGGAGVTVCSRWLVGEGDKHAFLCFLEDMGRKPTPSHTIDRFPNRDGNYEPGNCRWATMTEQNRNKNNNRIVTYMGREMCVAEACELSGIPHSRALYRLNRGWSVDAAFRD